MHARESVRVCECLVCVCERVNIAILNITAIKDRPQPEARETPRLQPPQHHHPPAGPQTIDSGYWTQHVLHPLSDSRIPGSVALVRAEPFVNSAGARWRARGGVEPNEEAGARPHQSIANAHTHRAAH